MNWQTLTKAAHNWKAVVQMQWIGCMTALSDLKMSLRVRDVRCCAI